jgi:ribonuclease E
MVLESNRELVLRRLTECLGRDRTKHQVTEITSLGLVQMTRKRIGQGLLESFSETCDHCKGRGVVIQTEPVADRPRSNVAEKVRAVAASTRVLNNEGAELGEAGEPGESVEAVELVEAFVVDDGNGRADEALTDVDGAEGAGSVTPEDDGDQGSSNRRRARRGGGRRRTRP